jgi:hypothetical protein
MISEGVSYDEVVRAAMSVMRANSAGEGGEEYTTPYVLEEPVPHNLRPGRPGFWEYYHPLTGQPLGAPYMTWTAAVFLDMLPG